MNRKPRRRMKPAGVFVYVQGAFPFMQEVPTIPLGLLKNPGKRLRRGCSPSTSCGSSSWSLRHRATVARHSAAHAGSQGRHPPDWIFVTGTECVAGKTRGEPLVRAGFVSDRGSTRHDAIPLVGIQTRISTSYWVGGSLFYEWIWLFAVYKPSSAELGRVREMRSSRLCPVRPLKCRHPGSQCRPRREGGLPESGVSTFLLCFFLDQQAGRKLCNISTSSVLDSGIRRNDEQNHTAP